MLGIDDLHDNLSSVQIGRVAVTSNSRAEAAEASVRIVFRQEERAVAAMVASRPLTVPLQNGAKFYPQIFFITIHGHRPTLHEQVRPSAQSVLVDPRGSQEQLGGRPPSGRQSLEVPWVASPL